MRTTFLTLCCLVLALFAETRRVTKIEDIPSGWICIARDPLGYAIKKPRAKRENMLSVTAVPSGYITVDIIKNWSPPYDMVTIIKVEEKKHTALGSQTIPPGYIVTDIIKNWKGRKDRYLLEKVEKEKHTMLSITPIPVGYREEGRIPNWRGNYDLITIVKKR